MEATVTAIDVLGGQSNKLQVVFDTQAFTYFNGAVGFVDGTYIAGGTGIGKQRIPPNNFVSTDVYVRIRIKVTINPDFPSAIVTLYNKLIMITNVGKILVAITL